jgi:hypothetical protein
MSNKDIDPPPPQISERGAFYVIWTVAGTAAITLADFRLDWIWWVVILTVLIGLTRGTLRFFGRDL